VTTVLVAGSAATTARAVELIEGAGGTALAAVVIRQTSIRPSSQVVVDLASGRYSWLVVTSRAAWDAVRSWDLGGAGVAAVGTGTAQAVRADGIDPLVPSTPGGAAALVDPIVDLVGRTPGVSQPAPRVLFARGNLAADTVTTGLRSRGVEVDEVTVYRTESLDDVPGPVRDAWPTIDDLLLTSPSATSALVRILGRPADHVRVTCLGPTTAQAATDEGIRVDRVGGSDLPGLVARLVPAEEHR
jgi:uroporphyrinogen-III synthase